MIVSFSDFLNDTEIAESSKGYYKVLTYIGNSETQETLPIVIDVRAGSQYEAKEIAYQRLRDRLVKP